MKIIDLASLAEAYPLAPAGGMFLAVVGAAMALGAAMMKRRYVLLGAGAAIATAATVFYATSHPIPRPSELQIASLIAAVALEMTAIAMARRALTKATERGRTLAILAIVGVHFFIMAPAFGPFVVALGACSLANTALAATTPRYPLPALWFVDAAIKVSAGATMLQSHASA